LGDDTIYVNNGSSTIFAGNGTNYVYAGNGSHLILSGSGNDAISVGNGNSTIIAGDGTNSIQAGDGFQQISTGSGDDDINLGSGGSVVDAGDGNNTIYGVGGDYVISAGSGNDIIILGNGNSTVFLGDGLNALYGENGNYSVASGIGDDSITLGIGNSFVSSGAGNDSIIVSGGDCILQGEAGDDYISAGAGNTLLDGGSGNDTLIGGIGNNTYMFGHGYGQDTISDYDMTTGNADTIYLKPDVTPSDVTLWRDASNLYLGINGTDDKITVQSWYDDSVYRVEQVKFADGTVWNEAALAAAKLFSTGGDDVVLGSYCNDIVDGRAGNDYILGDAGNDSLDGGVGNDILDGGADNDILADATGNNLLMGGDGDDTMAAGGGNLFIGGSGNDSITLEGGAAVIAFNRGDGQDAANFGAVMESVTVTLGGGIDYTDLAFGKAGNDLILGTGVDESITMKDWFSSLAGHGMVTLQVLAESMPGFDPLSGDPLLSQKVQTFDFTSLATRFDAELAADPTMTSWNLMNGLLDAHLASSDASALGGDLAYQYGVNGVLTGVGLAVAQDVLASPQFGSQAQTLRPWSTLNGGTVQLG
jgi:Ca2+-binding RTX toxin-like protein